VVRRLVDIARSFFVHADPGASADPKTMARALGALFTAGAALASISLLLPQEPDASRIGIASMAALALAAALFCFVGGPRLPQWFFPLAVAAAVVLVAGGIYFSDRSFSSYFLFFVWAVVWSFYFLPSWQGFVLIGFIGVTYPVVVSGMRLDDEMEQRWMMLMGTLLVVGVLVGLLRQRLDALIDRLTDAARTDPLTGLLNRRAFDEVLDLELSRAERSGTACSLILCDLDHFKRVNDTYGHPEGDTVLIRFAELLERAKRRIDAVARVGGEEFALVLPDTDEHGAFVSAERMRRLAREEFAGYRIPLTVSFGVAGYPRHGADPGALISAADQALYAAKQLGRDRSAIFRPEVTASLKAAHTEHDGDAVGHLSAVLLLADAVDARDPGSAAHSEAVGRYARAIAKELGLGSERADRLRLAGVVHDIGKMGVSDAILRKDGPLSEEDWVEMRSHVELGRRLLAGAGLEDVAAWVGAHHERPDGGGYPEGLAGLEIPLEARILAVADTWEALRSGRPWRPELTAAQAAEELRHGAGTLWDAAVVDALLRALEHDEDLAPAG